MKASTSFWNYFKLGLHIGVAAGMVGLIAHALVTDKDGGADSGDWLQFFGGVLGAGLAVVGAYFLEATRRRQEADEEFGKVLSEILTAANRAKLLYLKAKLVYPGETWKSVLAAGIVAEAVQVEMTLNRLLNKPGISDGAIEVGAGGIALMRVVQDAGKIFDEPNGLDFSQRACDRLAAGLAVWRAMSERYELVAQYGKRKGLIPQLVRYGPPARVVVHDP